MHLILNAMLLTTLTINQPMSNVVEPGHSILPDRLTSITVPTFQPILPEEFSATTRPSNVEDGEQYDLPDSPAELSC